MGLRLTRVDVRIQAAYFLKDNEAQGTIVDISSGGIGMEVRQILLPGDVIRVTFMTERGKTVDFWGIVRSVTGNFVGVKFEEISNENRDAIEEYVNDLIRARGLAAREKYQ